MTVSSATIFSSMMCTGTLQGEWTTGKAFYRWCYTSDLEAFLFFQNNFSDPLNWFFSTEWVVFGNLLEYIKSLMLSLTRAEIEPTCWHPMTQVDPENSLKVTFEFEIDLLFWRFLAAFLYGCLLVLVYFLRCVEKCFVSLSYHVSLCFHTFSSFRQVIPCFPS